MRILALTILAIGMVSKGPAASQTYDPALARKSPRVIGGIDGSTKAGQSGG
jgi:hypothetical protein